MHERQRGCFSREKRTPSVASRLLLGQPARLRFVPSEISPRPIRRACIKDACKQKRKDTPTPRRQFPSSHAAYTHIHTCVRVYMNTFACVYAHVYNTPGYDIQFSFFCLDRAPVRNIYSRLGCSRERATRGDIRIVNEGRGRRTAERQESDPRRVEKNTKGGRGVSFTPVPAPHTTPTQRAKREPERAHGRWPSRFGRVRTVQDRPCLSNRPCTPRQEIRGEKKLSRNSTDAT